MANTLPSSSGGAGLVPGQGAKIPHASWPKSQSIKQKPHCNKFNKDFKSGPRQKNLLKNVQKLKKKKKRNRKDSMTFPWFLCPTWGFPGGSDCKESAFNTGDLGYLLDSIPGSRRSFGEVVATHSSILT